MLSSQTIIIVILIIVLIGGGLYWKYGDSWWFGDSTPSVMASTSASASVMASTSASASTMGGTSQAPVVSQAPIYIPPETPAVTQAPSTGTPQGNKDLGESCEMDTDCINSGDYLLSCTEDQATKLKTCQKSRFIHAENQPLKRHVCYERACNTWMKNEGIFNPKNKSWNATNFPAEHACGNCGRVMIDNIGTLIKPGPDGKSIVNSSFVAWNIHDYKNKYEWLCFKNKDGKCDPDSSGL